jgi:acyl carrier protein
MSQDIMPAVVKRLLSEVEKDLNPEDVTRESGLRLDLGLDSMQAVTMVMDFEEEFGVAITED